ncbi:MAG: histidinol dehydrogenase [Candidatus Omnitrophica bacterium]|nr:histidinol dehydrogenase [Candidatus Omnitrophota bacterium]MBU4479616.1 histidinol dehydrogenase [Candidatus Omnitrophota bacterium]MCG2704028.1 histidinol dehydrogenase [Candidatus Omnitrophota bacterium]
MKVVRFSGKTLERIYSRLAQRKVRVKRTVEKIVQDIELKGDEALIFYTKKFDQVKLTVKQLKVTEAETNGAYQNIDAEFIASLKIAINNVTAFYKKQIKKSWKIRGEDGISLGEIFRPIEKVGIYVPGGTAPLVSSVYMSVLPAKIAGVSEIYLATPPAASGEVNPYILAVANLLKVNAVYKLGGAQAIAAFAFGTKTVPKVDKIVGPGNDYVTEAKRQVFGYVDIDMLAGPSEVVIIANSFANPNHVIADLQAQAEHRLGVAVLITPSRKLARIVRKEIINGYVIMVKNLDEALDVANKIAPEHLEILVKQPEKLVKKIKNAGAVFIGAYSPVVLGDYIAGPSHVLPTSGTARFFSGLGVGDFMKSTHIINYSKKALEKVAPAVEKIASIEGLKKHILSLKSRIE